MNFEKLYAMQNGLDRHIEEKHKLTEESLFERKVLALLVELGELANETRCFKFWSSKPASDKQIILEEFVDGVHFILSLGIECGFQFSEELSEEIPVRSVSEQFLEIYGAVQQFQVSKSEKEYIALFQQYLLLANMLGFSVKEIEQAYFQKNEVNYERQQKGY